MIMACNPCFDILFGVIMDSQLIVDKESKQQHNLSDMRESVVFHI